MKNIQKVPFSEDVNLLSYEIFTGLTEEQIDSLTQHMNCTIHKRGSILYEEGNRVKGTFIVIKGILKIYKTGFDGKEQIIRFAKDGELIGFRSILSEELACTTAKVINDAALCYIPAEELTSLIKTNPDFAMSLMKITCRELGESNKFLTDIAQKTVRERLAEVLLLLKETFGLEEDSTLMISLTREELANIVGTATESVIRLLSDFKTEKLIELNGRRIKLLDIAELTKVGNVYE